MTNVELIIMNAQLLEVEEGELDLTVGYTNGNILTNPTLVKLRLP